MKRTEYLYRLNSDNWGDYQVAIRELKSVVRELVSPLEGWQNENN